MKELLLKGLSCGVVAGIATNVLFGDAGTISFMDMDINPAIVSGVSVAAGSVASDMLSENIIEKMNLPQNVQSTEEMLIRTGVCGASSAAVLAFAGIPSANIWKAVALGAGSKLGGDLAYDKLLDPRHGMVPIF